MVSMRELYKTITDLRRDGWQNIVTGLGTASDKSSATRFFRGAQVPEDQLAHAYEESDIVGTIAERLPVTALRRGLTVEYNGEADRDLFTSLEQVNGIEELKQAWIWGRLFGGGVVFMNFDDDGSLADPPKVPNGGIKNLVTFDRREVRPGVEHDLQGPVWYHVMFRRGTLKVHRSRLLLFKGRRLPNREAANRQYWGVGVVERAWDEIKDFETVWMAIRNMIADANQGVFTLPGFTEIVANGFGEGILERMRILDQARSVARSIVIDSEENFRREATNFTGLADLIDRSAQRLAQAVEMPATILLQRSPAGLNATGESDILNWYDTVEAEREISLVPNLLLLIQWLALGQHKDPSAVSIEWPSLWSMTEFEKNQADQGRLTTLTTAETAGYISKQEGRSIWRSEQGLPDDTPETAASAQIEEETDDRVEEIVKVDLIYNEEQKKWSYSLHFEGGSQEDGELSYVRSGVKIKTLLQGVRQKYTMTPSFAAQLYRLRPDDFVHVGTGYRWTSTGG